MALMIAKAIGKMTLQLASMRLMPAVVSQYNSEACRIAANWVPEVKSTIRSMRPIMYAFIGWNESVSSS